MILGIIAV